MTLAQIMNSLLQNSDLNWRKYGNPLEHSDMSLIKFIFSSLWKPYSYLKTLITNPLVFSLRMIYSTLKYQPPDS